MTINLKATHMQIMSLLQILHINLIVRRFPGTVCIPGTSKRKKKYGFIVFLQVELAAVQKLPSSYFDRYKADT